jgi:transcription elongation factor Elf1
MNEVMTDLVCCDCGGPVMIVGRDASCITVVCCDCGNSHQIEVVTDLDGKPVYWPSFRLSLKGESV